MMCVKDQEARYKVIEQQVSDEILLNIDSEHLPILKSIVDDYGWPGYNLIGEDGADMFWLLIQHCDQDLEFQKKCLELLKNAVASQDAPKKHLAYLTDRVLVNSGEDQLYGTQATSDNGIVLSSISDPDHLDERRRDMELCPIDEYLTLLNEVYLRP
ncbi:MAG: hypothetical protein JHC93_00115 [Parachlamydiales bacterium]|nr:hypothetical protein [Parachlamydiales bacterium]